jgi:hypothetical protein
VGWAYLLLHPEHQLAHANFFASSLALTSQLPRSLKVETPRRIRHHAVIMGSTFDADQAFAQILADRFRVARGTSHYFLRLRACFFSFVRISRR